jgi:hypothetical protein
VKITRFRTPFALLAGALLVVACEATFDDGAQLANLDVPLETWAISGSPASFPTALLVPQHTVVRPDVSGSFDLAFDIDDDGRLHVIPVSKVVTAIGGNRTIGLLRGDGPYATIVDAPRTGWMFDTTLVVNPGSSFLVKVQTLYCQFDFRQDIYAKIFVDSVIPAERRAKLSMRVNPNCGFRSFASGVPEY